MPPYNANGSFVAESIGISHSKGLAMSSLLARLKISAKIIILLSMLAVVTLAVAAMGARTLAVSDAAYSELTLAKLPVTTKFARVNRAGTTMAYDTYRAVNAPAGSAAMTKAINDATKAYENASTMLAEVNKTDPNAQSDADNVRRMLDGLHDEAAKAIELARGGQPDAARVQMGVVDRALENMSTSMVSMNLRRIDAAQALSQQLSVDGSRTIWTMLIGSIVAIIGAIGVSIVVSRQGITGPLEALQQTMAQLAAGNHHVDVPGTERTDELGTMAKAVLVFRDAAVEQERVQAEKAAADAEQRKVVQALEANLSKLAAGDLTAAINERFSAAYETVKVNFNDAVAALSSLIGTVRERAETIRTGSQEIAVASEDLARRTESNAASLEQTSAAVAQIDQRIKATATAAGDTVQRADDAIKTVSSGRAVADEAVQAMTRVADSAKGIDSVIEGLDKIAFQTRVLAMNAAVEAGRAGEAGRGFAVVADLVSQLAMRSEEEAGRAREQLTATQSDIVAAVEMVQKVDNALADITSDVGAVHGLLGQMAADNHAQSSAITQISVAVSSMDQSTQQNAAMVEETSAAARNLTNEVNELAGQASHFKIDGNTAARASARAAKPAANAGYVSPVKPLPVPVSTPAGADAWAQF